MRVNSQLEDFSVQERRKELKSFVLKLSAHEKSDHTFERMPQRQRMKKQRKTTKSSMKCMFKGLGNHKMAMSLVSQRDVEHIWAQPVANQKTLVCSAN